MDKQEMDKQEKRDKIIFLTGCASTVLFSAYMILLVNIIEQIKLYEISNIYILLAFSILVLIVVFVSIRKIGIFVVPANAFARWFVNGAL